MTHASRASRPIWPDVLAGVLLGIAASSSLLAQIEVNEADGQSLREHCHAIRLDDSADFADLEFFRALLQDKRVVLLGESNHGSHEIFLLKNRLIRFLHEELGYRVLLLESGIGEVYALNYRRDELSARQMLSAGLIGPWRSREFVDLMDYAKQTPTLYLGGYDVQRSGRAFGDILERALDAVEAVVDSSTDKFRGIERRFSDVQPKLTNLQRDFDLETAEEVASLGANFVSLIELVTSNSSALPRETWAPEQAPILVETLRNRIAYLDYFAQFRGDNNFRRRWEARDRALARNVLLFANELFPDEKVIISGHNFHVARYNATEHVMGEMLAETFGESMYSIGLFAGSGTFANNARVAEQLDEPTADNDIQHVIRRLGMPAAFLEVPDQPSPDTQWLFEGTVVNHTFLDLAGRNTLILGRAFDGLLMIAEISMAQY